MRWYDESSQRQEKKARARPHSDWLFLHFKKKRAGKPSCFGCGAAIQGAAHSEELSKTQRFPSRAFGFSLCHSCLAEAVSFAARVSKNEVRLADVNIKLRPFVEKILSKR